MKIETDGQLATITIEDPFAQSAFLRGRENPKVWGSTPETYELAKFMQDNTQYSQVFVRCGEAYSRIK